MTNEEFEREYYPRYADVICAIARKYSACNADMYDDMVSVGTIGLLEADPSKAQTNVDAFLRMCIRNKIIDHIRWFNRRDFLELEALLVCGYDVARDSQTGEVVLIHPENDSLASQDDDTEAGPLLHPSNASKTYRRASPARNVSTREPSQVWLHSSKKPTESP